MTDLAEAPEALSTQLEPDMGQGASGGGAPKLEHEKPSLRDTIADAVKQDAKEPDDKSADPPADKKAAEKGEEKPSEEAKPTEAKDGEKGAERGADGKFKGKEAEAGEPKAAEPESKTEQQPKSNGHIEPPTKFLPDAKETWRNTPRPVQRDVENLVREHEAEITRHREASERYEPLRQFDDLVRQNGRAGLHETLAEVAQLEDLMGKDPLSALNQVLLRAGPRKADGQPYSLYEVAQSVVQMGPQGYQQAMSRSAQQQAPQNDNPRVAQLEQQLAKLQEQTVAATVIEPFKRDHPRYDELQRDIALFLQSGKIPTSLSPSDRLAAAYDMAERINPPSNVSAAAETDPDPGRRADDTFSGSKSIKSAPGAITPDLEPERGGSTRDILRAELRRAKV